MGNASIKKEAVVAGLVALGVFFPIFFTLSGGLYKTSQTLTDSGGVIADLPLPISILTCSMAILYSWERVKDSCAANWTLYIMILALAISFLFASEHGVSSSRKLIMALQVILPFFGLIVGQAIQDENKSISKAFFIALYIIVPFRLTGSIMNSPWNVGNLLTDQVLFFTIYSHIQFVTLIFVCAFAYAFSQLYDNFKFLMLGLCLIMLLYVLKSWSYLTIGAYFGFVGLFFLKRIRISIGNSLYILSFMALLVVASIYLARAFEGEDGKSGILWHYTGATYNKIKPLTEGKIPQNVQERIQDWRRYSDGIIESPQTMLFGHAQPMPREIRSSAHNWYIDTMYTFGMIGVLPVVGLVFYSLRLCWLYRRLIPIETWWLVGIVFYLVLIDSNFKVTLRQPYPGIFTFFMWGLLLTRLKEIKERLATNL